MKNKIMAQSDIALFLPSLEYGGAERMMVDLSYGLAKRGLTVDLVLVNAKGHFLPQVPPKVRVLDLGARRVLTSLPALVRYLRRERPVALLSALDHTNVVALWARWLARVPTRVVVSVHSTISLNCQNSDKFKDRLIPRLARIFYPCAHAIVAVSRGAAMDLTRTSGLPIERIRVIHNPITYELLSKVHEPLAHPWFTPNQPPVILAVGRLTTAKDYPTLIRAFALLREQQLAKLMILGEGEERHRLEVMVHDLGLEEDVSLSGFVSNPYAYMAKAAVFVLSSVWEGFSTALIEALACGCPVVSTNCPNGPAEILEGGRYGRLVPMGNVEALADAMLTTLRAPPDTKVLKMRADEFSLNNIVDKYIGVLDSSS